MISVLFLTNNIEIHGENINSKITLNHSSQIHNKFKVSESSGVTIEFDKNFGFVSHKNNIVLSFNINSNYEEYDSAVVSLMDYHNSKNNTEILLSSTNNSGEITFSSNFIGEDELIISLSIFQDDVQVEFKEYNLFLTANEDVDCYNFESFDKNYEILYDFRNPK